MYIKQGYKVVEKKATKKRDSKPENSLTKESMLAMLKADKLDNLYKKYEKKIAEKENFMKMKKEFLEDMKKAILAELTEKKPERLSYYSEAFSKKGASVLSIREEYKKEFYSEPIAQAYKQGFPPLLFFLPVAFGYTLMT